MPDRVSVRDSFESGAMTRNRTAVNVFSAVSSTLMGVLLLVLAIGLAMAQYLAGARDRMRRVEGRLRRRAVRRIAL